MNKSSPQISVLMPAYNAAKFIEESIKSILNQTFKDFELIIVDDASQDNTWKIITRLAKKDSRMRIYRNRYNLYIAGNRNRLLTLARGEFIAWQDADDISMPTRLAKQYEFLKPNKDVGIVGAYLQFFDGVKSLSIRKYLLEDSSLRRTIFRFSPVAQPVAMIRKECFVYAGLYNLNYPPAEDLDMSFRIGRKYKFANLPEVLLRYRVSPGSATFSKLRKIEISSIKIRTENLKIESYDPTVFDKIYLRLHFISIFILPARFKIWLFDKMRNEHYN